MISAKWWRLVRKPLIAFTWVLLAVFATGVVLFLDGLWRVLPLLVDASARLLLAGTASVVALGAWWLSRRLTKRQVAGPVAVGVAGAVGYTGWWWLLVGLAVLPLLVFGAWWLWWGLPKRQVNQIRLPDPKERADAEDNFRKTVGQLLGGIAAALIAATFTYFQGEAIRRQSVISEQTSQDQRISNEVSKGFELIGNENKISFSGSAGFTFWNMR